MKKVFFIMNNNADAKEDKFVLKPPKDAQGNGWNSDMEAEDFVQPAWVVRQEQQFALTQGKKSSFLESNRDSILNDARIIASLKAQDARERKAKKLAKKESNQKKMGIRVQAIKDAAKKRIKVSKDTSKAKTTPITTPSPKTQDKQSLFQTPPSVIATTPSTVPSIGSTSSTVTSSSPSWDRVKYHNSGLIKLEGDHVLFPSYDVTLTLAGATCIACKKPHKECCEMKYRDFCLHSVTDYIQSVGSNGVTESGLRNAYRTAYTTQVKLDLLKTTGFYETNPMVRLPWCMVQGSLVQSLNLLVRGSPAAQFLESKRVADVEEHVRSDGIPLNQLTQVD